MNNIRYHVDSPVIMAAAAMVVNDYIDVFDDATTIVAKTRCPADFRATRTSHCNESNTLTILTKTSGVLALLILTARLLWPTKSGAMWYQLSIRGNDVPV